ncbi:hypothetical protein ACO0LM_12060 [Undibacterium sp. Di26W]|uniref:hypothetical protein n=1 Tax=Undibacterium sp. Di26W TaxID=3413035 RepID=UPI003BF43E08
MIPTAHFRWNIVENPGVTAEIVRAERERTHEPLAVCNARLRDRKPAVLQQWCIHDNDFDDGIWINVPFVFNGELRMSPSDPEV